MSVARRKLTLRELQNEEMEAEMREERLRLARAAPPRSFPPAGTRRADVGRNIDIHETLKNEAFASEGPGCNSHFEKSRPCPTAPWGISDQYMILDSFHKVQSSAVDRGEYKWNFMVQGVTGDEVIGVHDKLDNIIEIQMSEFVLPIIPEVPYVLRAAPPVTPTGTNQLVLIQNNNNAVAPNNPRLLAAQYPASIPSQAVWVNNPYTQLPYGARLTVQFAEAGLQSYSDANGARHHWEFAVGYGATTVGNPNMLLAAPFGGRRWDAFIFTEPLQDVLGMTLVFRGPDSRVRFQQDCLYDVTVASDGAVAPGPFLAFTAADHGLLVGDRIFVSGFRSGVSALDAYVNRTEGHVASGDPALPALAPSTPIPTPNTFWLDPAPSIIDMTAPPPVLPQTVTVCIAKRRLRIAIKLRRIVQRLTNYMTPVS
jgi:hypothetical protein